MNPFPKLAGVQDVYALSENLWKDCPLRVNPLNRIGRGAVWFEDFQSVPTATQAGIITVTANAGTFTLEDNAFGVGLLTGTATAGEGPNIQFCGAEIFKPVAGLTIWGECRIQMRTSPAEVFFGLGQTDTTFAPHASPTVLTSQGVGVSSLTGDYVFLGKAKDGSSTTNTTAAIATMSDGSGSTAIYATTWKKLGFKITGTSLVEFFVDGVKSQYTVAANIPTTEMRPTLVGQSSTTTAAILAIDWGAIVQDRSEATTTA